MGAWGAGSFENDIALDWAAECKSIDDISSKFDDLEAIDQSQCNDHDPYVDADLASEVVAAAEAVAMLMGSVSSDFPDDLREELKTAGEPDSQLIDKAKHSISRILMASELLELWSKDEDQSGEWNIAITGLIDRLNGNVPIDPPAKDKIEQAQGYLTTCVFCDKEIEENQAFQLEFRDLSTVDGLYVSRGLYCHLKCLNGKLHSKHMIQNWRFNIDNAEIDRILSEDQG